LGGAGVVLAAVALVAPAANADVATNRFVIVNAASFLGNPVSRGTLLTIFTNTPVSDEKFHVFNDWVDQTPDGLWVEASCQGYTDMVHLPILFDGWSYGGTQINVYYPNLNYKPRSCADGGLSQVRVHPATGHGEVMAQDVETVPDHPGIFAVGDAPAGDHLDGQSGAPTATLADCNSALPADLTKCPISTNKASAMLKLYLTGADGFRCTGTACDGSNLVFQLAMVTDGTVGDWVQQDLLDLVTDSTGVQRARVRVHGFNDAGEYRIRVRKLNGSDIPPPLTVEFGSPT
jgi:uncharacterized protein (TIGR03437 family)